jgi:hypothetical protein
MVPLAVLASLLSLSAEMLPCQSEAPPVVYHGTASAGPLLYAPLHVALNRSAAAVCP